ncbi:hypothetical protein Peur_051426 [Populus x canadensis]
MIEEGEESQQSYYCKPHLHPFSSSVTISTVIGCNMEADPCNGVGLLIRHCMVFWWHDIYPRSGDHANPAVTFCLFIAKKGIIDTSRWIIWWLNAWEQQAFIGTFVLVYTVFSATDPKRSARFSHVPVRFMVHLATIPTTGTGINPARNFEAASCYI